MPNTLILEEIKLSAIEKWIAALPEKALDLGVRVALAVIFFFLGVQLIKLIRKIVRGAMTRANAEKGAVQFIDSFIRMALYVVFVMLIAVNFGVDATSIVALLGSAGVAIGLALQGSLSNLAGGVLLLILKPFVVGDYILENASGQEGTVVEIQIFYTKLRTGDNKIIILPNGTLANNSIVNFTTANKRRCDILVTISYDSDIKKAKDVLLKLIKEDEKTLKDEVLDVFVSDLADSAVVLGVRCWFLNDDYWQGRWRLLENVKYALDEEGISIPFPQLDVHIQQ